MLAAPSPAEGRRHHRDHRHGETRPLSVAAGPARALDSCARRAMQRTGAALGLVFVFAGAAAAMPTSPVELLHNVPSVVAVSSRVRNANIHPAEMVDGNLGT